eukprot:Amastigsp_a358363_42.p3 type:complete len:121 gc:universal Amastigsp_a358363_42:611-249(-)
MERVARVRVHHDPLAHQHRGPEQNGLRAKERAQVLERRRQKTRLVVKVLCVKGTVLSRIARALHIDFHVRLQHIEHVARAPVHRTQKLTQRIVLLGEELGRQNKDRERSHAGQLLGIDLL